MARYTIELNKIINSNINVFDFEYDFYTDNPSIKRDFEKKFLQVYMFDEIGFETISRFKMRLKTTLDLIAPFYKELYYTQMATKKIDFLLNKDYEEVYERVLEDTNELVKNNNITNDTTNTYTSDNKSSDIENGMSNAALEDKSLTSVSNTKDSDTTKNTLIGDSTDKEKGTIKETIKTTGKGNIGITSASDLISGWRSIIINIDEMIIDECYDLFMRVY